MSRYVVAQTPDSGSWIHYLCGWYGEVPVWERDRERALKVDEASARQLVERFDHRYKRVVRHYIEELPNG